MKMTKRIVSRNSTMTIDEHIKAECGAMLTFPTICYRAQHHNVEAMNNDLSMIVRELETKGDSASYMNSVKGGFHSKSTFFNIDHPSVKQLQHLILKHLQQYLRHYWPSESSIPLEELGDMKIQMWGWSLILRAGHISAPHIHPHCLISGVYYPEIPEQASDPGTQSGSFILCDPRPRAGVNPLRGQGNTLVIQPKEGLLLMFPSHMEHYVMPFEGKGERLSIAFNIDLPQVAKGS